MLSSGKGRSLQLALDCTLSYLFWFAGTQSSAQETVTNWQLSSNQYDHAIRSFRKSSLNTAAFRNFEAEANLQLINAEE
jgi:hypothetical protein